MLKNEINHFFLQPAWPAPTHIKAYTTLRPSGIGDRHKPDAVINYGLLKTSLHLPNEPAWLTQKHTNIAVKAAVFAQRPIADASYSDAPGQVCAVLTADCLPVLITNCQGTKIAAIHAGWRGLASGIIETTLTTLAIDADDALVWLGPAIGPQHFEVRKDVYAIFTSEDSESKAAFTLFAEEHWHADLYQLARIRLQRKGVNAIFGGGLCTYSDQKNYFSYRRDGITTGRIVTLIWMDTSEDIGRKI